MILTHHNQSHATHYTHQRFHTSHDSLMMRCYNMYIRTKFNYSPQSHKDAIMPDTVHTQGRSTYDLYFEIDCDCEELLDAIGLEYKQCEDDDTQNEIGISLTREEFSDVFETIQLTKASETLFGTRLLNPELGEYVTKVTVYTPHGDKFTFE